MVLAGKPSVRCSCFSGSYLIQIFLKTQGCQQETRKKINQKEWGCPGSSRSSAFCMPKMFFFSFIKSRGRLPTSCQHPPFCACSVLLWVCVCVYFCCDSGRQEEFVRCQIFVNCCYLLSSHFHKKKSFHKAEEG